MTGAAGFRVVTYNIHKCRGMDRRVDPGRIAAVLQDIRADVIALQEVVGEGGSSDDHAATIAARLGMHASRGENRRHRGSAYGNVVLSRVPPHAAYNFDISVRGREARGCQRVDLVMGGRQVHVFNVHLGTSYPERREQAHKLLSPEILQHAGLSGARVLLGDFNEWIRGPASRLLAARLESADLKRHLGYGRSYPGILPVLHLDHIYFDSSLELRRLALGRGGRALLASDHLPLLAEFQWVCDGRRGAGMRGRVDS